MGDEIDALLMNEEIKQLIKQKNQFYKDSLEVIKVFVILISLNCSKID